MEGKDESDFLKTAEEVIKILGGTRGEDDEIRLSTKEFGDACRLLNTNPSDFSIKRVLKKYNKRLRKTKNPAQCQITLSEFCEMFKNVKDMDITEEEMGCAFSIFTPKEIMRDFKISIKYSQEEFTEYVMKKFYPEFLHDQQNL